MYDPLDIGGTERYEKRQNNGVLQKLYGRPSADNNVVNDLHVKHIGLTSDLPYISRSTCV